jgi:hypothetical protein
MIVWTLRSILENLIKYIRSTSMITEVRRLVVTKIRTEFALNMPEFTNKFFMPNFILDLHYKIFEVLYFVRIETNLTFFIGILFKFSFVAHNLAANITFLNIKIITSLSPFESPLIILCEISKKASISWKVQPSSVTWALDCSSNSNVVGTLVILYLFKPYSNNLFPTLTQ